MNYAIIGPQGGINRVTDKEPQTVAEGVTVVEITDEQAATISAGASATPRVLYFYEDGEIVSGQEKREAREAQRKAEMDAKRAELAEQRRVAAEANRPAITAEKHIEREGYPAIRLVTLMDLEGKLAEAGKTSAKLTAVRGWLDTILGAFAANPEPRNDWPKAPFGFEETVQDAAFTLSDQ
jgi:hypothetical protein